MNMKINLNLTSISTRVTGKGVWETAEAADTIKI